MGIKEQVKAMSYLVKERPFPLEKPIVLQFPVIDICNSQCQMCRIWENKQSDDISVDELRKGLRNPLYSEVTGVGLNGGEPTLRKDLGLLAAVLFEELPKLRSISLITNAYRYEEVIERITDVGKVVKQHGGFLDVMVSLDGYGEMHDRVRGKPGNFERAQHVIDFIQTSPLVDNVRIGCTIIKENVYGLADLFEYCQQKGLYIKYRLGVPHQRLYTQNLLDPYALSAEEKYHVAEFMEGLIAHYESSDQQKFFYRSLIDQLVLGAPRKAGCDWQHRGATITSKGELLYCAVQSKVLGKITEGDSEQMFFGNADHLQQIIDQHCANCHHDYVGIPPKREYAKQLAARYSARLGVEPLLRRAHRSLQGGPARQRQHFEQHLARMQAMATEPPRAPMAGRAGKRVLICGWYGTETLGDKGILGGVLHALRQQLGAIDVTLVSLFPYVSEMTRRQMPELHGCRIVDPEEGVRQAGDMDLVVFGGGPLMAINELADMQAIFGAARQKGVHTLVAGCGVGPFGEAWHDNALKQILSMADARIYRDERSRQLVADMGLDVSRDQAVEDPAFTWLKLQRPQLQGRPDPQHPVLLLGLRDFPYASYARHLSEADCLAAKDRYERAVVEALERLVQQHPRLTIRPLPMCTNHFGDDDRWFYRRLLRPSTVLQNRLDLSLLREELPPLAYCEAFRQASVALTMRFHSLVFALGLEVPTVVIDYTMGKGKVDALARRFGAPHRNLADLDANFLVDHVNQLLMQPPSRPAPEPAFETAMQQALAGLSLARAA